MNYKNQLKNIYTGYKAYIKDTIDQYKYLDI